MKKEFEEVKIEVIPFDDEDVIRTSADMTTNGLYGGDDSTLDDFFGMSGN